MSEDPIVTLLDGTKMPKSKVPTDTIYINEKGQKVKKVIKENPNDPFVTLLDGTKMPKSKVPFDTIYINEKGQKVKKVKTASGDSALISNAKNLLTNVGERFSTAATNIKDTAISSITTTKDNVLEFAVGKIQILLQKIDINSTVSALETYQKQSGKDIQKLIDFIVKLKNIK